MRRWAPLLMATVLGGCGTSTASPSHSPPPSPTPPAIGAAVPSAPDPESLVRPVAGSGVPVAGQAPAPGKPWFLTVGDSITSGYTRDPGRAGVNSGWPVQLENRLAASGRPWRLFNTACPGETTETYETLCPERRYIPFLADRSQHDVAVTAVKEHLADLRLIVVGLGSNDLLRATTQGGGPDAVLTPVAGRVDAIVAEFRRLAPTVPLVVANYYDPFANAAPQTLPPVRTINASIVDLARRQGAIVADFFGAINGASPGADLCTLIDCAHFDPVHPNVAGHARLAATVFAVVPAP